MSTNPLDPFLEPTRSWFETTLGQPTPPQAQGWPAIQRGENTLILAPTGSGKTLSAFLWGIDQIFREEGAGNEEDGLEGDDLDTPTPKDSGRPTNSKTSSRTTHHESRITNHELHLLYISPLKALNNDIQRNLRAPLAGIRKTAAELGVALPEINVAVRSGDTPQRERQAMLRKPPHILITTPESLYLMLTSPKARGIFSTVRTVIIDEIHTLAGSKRGVHLSISLERLQRIAEQPVQRIGLSATIQPLDEVARYLGGGEMGMGNGEDDAPNHPTSSKTGSRTTHHAPRNHQFTPRPVTIVDAAYDKTLDLLVETVAEDFHNLPGESIWPTIIPRTVELMNEHKSTLIFVNNRRLAERTADRLNEQIAAEDAGEENALIEDGVAKGLGMMAAGMGEAPAIIRAHHGSVSKEMRLQLEKELKAGKLPAIVGTSSLELGIDIGAIDLVVQYHSPKTVAEGLQRVGRSGHLVGQTSKGRIFPTHREDIMEAAAVAGGMKRGEVEPTYTPRTPLDILAQQIVAIVSVEDWNADALYDLICQSYAYRDLTPRVYNAVLDMLSGRYPSDVHRNLRARLVWDRVNNQLAALPGSRLLALTNGGSITDKGSFGAYLTGSNTKLGELDEEFVYETRVGDTFMLGSQVWRVTDITDAKVMVADATGATPRMPFWRGDFAWRPYDLGARVGSFRRTVAEKLSAIMAGLDLKNYRSILQMRAEEPVQEMLTWLQTDYALDFNSAWHVIDYVAGQLDHTGSISSDKAILVEVFEDAIGDPRMVIQAPFGGRVNGLWALALGGALRERTGVEVEIQTNDEGILFRFPDADADFPLDLITEMTPAKAREYILQELPDSPVFGAQFRQNAARALLLPGLGVGKRTPFWLQRLRAKDLLQVVRQLEDFPIVAETYRDCLEEVMDLPSLEKVLAGIQQGEIQIVPLESINPSPVANSLLWHFIDFYMYEWDAPKAERQLQTAALNRNLLQDLLIDVDLSELLRTEAVDAVRARLQHTTPETQARSAEELALLFQNLGDLTASEVAARSLVDSSGWIGQLAGAQRITELEIPTAPTPHEPPTPQERWVHAEYAQEYKDAFSADPISPTADEAEEEPNEKEPLETARRAILDRYLIHAGPITQEAILARYAFPADWLEKELERRIALRDLVHGRFTPGETAADIDERVDPADAGTADSLLGSGQQSGQQSGSEFLERRTLEQIHRRTLTILRNEVKAVPFTQYVDFLTRWQHLHPSTRLDAQLDSAGSLHQALQKLRGLPVVGRTWERDVLPLRIQGYKPAELTELCQRGDVVWVGAGGADPQRGRIRFFYRGEGGAFLEEVGRAVSLSSSLSATVAPEKSGDKDYDNDKDYDYDKEVSVVDGEATLSQNAEAVYQFLKSEGAVFLADVQAGLELKLNDAEAALIELAMAGLVTNDSIAILRSEVPKRTNSTAAASRATSSLEAELAARLSNTQSNRSGRSSRSSGRPSYGGLKRPGRTEFSAAKRRVGERLARQNASNAPTLSPPEPTQSTNLPGRWTLVHRIGVLGKDLPASEKIARQVRQLFARYGVVTRKSLNNEIGSWAWYPIYQELQRLEMRGEVRRGYFVLGLPGVQFALPEVVDQLRRRGERGEGSGGGNGFDDAAEEHLEHSLVVLNACDPANVFSLADLSGEEGEQSVLPLTETGEPLRFSRIPSTWVVLQGGLPLLLLEDTGGAITSVKGVDDVLTGQALSAWVDHAITFENRLMIKTWNGESVLNSAGQPLLEALGFYRDYPGMSWSGGR